MNRILFEHDEIHDGIATFGGVRAEHVLEVLHGEVGQILKTGEINGLIGTGEIVAIEDASGARDIHRQSRREAVARVVRALYGGDEQQFRTGRALAPRMVTVALHHTQPSLMPWVDLILAPPRPRVMKRLLPQLATMGVGRIFLVGAKKVEKDFWGATLLKEENYRPLLVEGLMQGGTSILPTLEMRRNFRRFVADELDALFPSARRIVAHPYAADASGCAAPISSCVFRPSAETLTTRQECRVSSAATPKGDATFLSREKKADIHLSHATGMSRLLLAIGPEGGWTDDEVALLESHGFTRYSLGSRILRTDTATIALLAKLNDE